MAYTHLDQAARESGKSEVTLRRLIKAGKVSHKKEKTHTGFIYLVDPVEVKQYYSRLAEAQEPATTKSRPAPAAEAKSEEASAPKPPTEHKSDGGDSAYWRGRADQYEGKYYTELEKAAQLREELGQWRGRAEQAQGMLIKLLPGPTESFSQVHTESDEKKPESLKNERQTTTVVMVVLFAAAFIFLAIGTYLNLRA